MFRTELPLTPHPQQLPPSARVLTIGSCFSDSIGTRLAVDKVRTLVNPFGTVFNPLSACKLLRAAAGEDMDWQQHLVEARGRWQSYDLHASLGADSPVDLLQQLQQLLRDTGVFLATADVVVLTLGTAWAYRLKETDELVSNCHKVPADKFDKELITPDEIINAVAETHAYLRQHNPKLRFVLTVSPVRHLKDTLPLNAVSKSVLRVACHYLSELLPDVSYFPAYELLLDDLRDYRFYADDMLHPSKVAEDYIWERFARTYFDVDFGRFRKEWESVRQALNHRPLYEAAPEHRQFLESTLQRLEKLAAHADLRMEILDVRRQIENLPAPKALPEPEPEDDEERIDIGDVVPAVQETVFTVELSDSEEAIALDVEEATEGAEPAEGLPKKKRRSRGGAKRNKKKHAARLAAEAEALALATGETTQNAALPLDGVTIEPEQQADSTVSLPEAVDYHDNVVVADEAEPEAESATQFESDVTVPEAGTPKPQRPGRTGRSASEVRAAAVRRPHRSGGRIRPLYAADAEASAAAEPVAERVEPSSVSAELPVAAETAATEAAAVEVAPIATAATTVAAPKPPIVVARPKTTPTVIPAARGTGASGMLSESGKASINAGQAKPRNIAPTAAPAAEAPLTATPPQETAAVPEALPPVAAPAMDAAATETAPAPAAAKPRRRPAAKPKAVKPAQDAPAEPAPVAEAAVTVSTEPAAAEAVPAETASAAVAATKKKPISASKAPKAPRRKAEPAAAEAPATPPAPARRSRKAAPPVAEAAASAPEAAPPAAETPETPKRAKRAPRRKPAAPDNLPEAS